MVSIDIETEAGQKETLRRMLLIREFDGKAKELFADGEIPGFVHLYLGEEAVGVGACGALEEDDYITSTHRGHGHCIAKGLDPKQMMAELLGRREGYCNGKGGSMHIADVDAGMLGANGIVGAGPPLAAGAALTAQYKEEDRVALSFTGDGGVAQGQVHEAINLASAWDLPAVFVIENNQYGEGTPVEKQHRAENLSDTAGAYDIPGITVDGMDITAVYEAVEEARKRARDGKGPTLIEAKTYRYQGHFEGDEQVYREDEEVEEWKERDPITSFKDRLVEQGTLTEEEFESMRDEASEEVEAAVESAREAEEPSPVEAYEDMFSATVPELQQFADEAQTRADGGINGGDM